MKKTLVLLLVMGAFVGCASPTPDVVKETVQVEFTTIVEITKIVEVPVTVEVEVTREVAVTVTPTQPPLYTPTITLTPTETPIPSPTLDPLKQAKRDGFYLVGIDIAPGVWRSTPGHDGCYWSITTKTGSIVDNHFGMSGGTCYISPSAYQVEFNDCGEWSWLSD